MNIPFRISNERMIEYLDNFYIKPLKKWREISDNPLSQPPVWFDGSDEFIIPIKTSEEQGVFNEWLEKHNNLFIGNPPFKTPYIKLTSDNCPTGAKCIPHSMNMNDKTISISAYDYYGSLDDDIIIFS